MSIDSYGTMDRMVVTDSEGSAACTGDGFSCLLRYNSSAQDYFLPREHDSVTIQVGDKVIAIDHLVDGECTVRFYNLDDRRTEVRKPVRFPVDWSTIKVERVLP